MVLVLKFLIYKIHPPQWRKVSKNSKRAEVWS